jgi:hypothetical protein
MEYLSYKRNLRAYTIDLETSLAVKIAGCRPAIAGRRTTLLNARSVFTGHLPEPGHRARPMGLRELPSGTLQAMRAPRLIRGDAAGAKHHHDA